MLGKIFLFCCFSFGEEQQKSISDTLVLQEIAVYASSLEKYAVGQQVLSFENNLIEKFSGRSLGDLLQQNTGLYVRQYGEGMVSSLTMRGTSAGHTAVFWNGLPLNSPSLGQSDFSLLPIEAIGKFAVHYGSSGALYGTDAIGGSVHLSSDLKFNQGHQFQVKQGLGSFGRINSGLSYGFSNKKWASMTKIYRNNSENDFKYRDLTRKGFPVKRSTNAAVKQWGMVQNLAWNINNSSQLSSSIWYNFSDRQIQALMGSNSQEVQEDKQLRWVLDYKLFFGLNAMNLKLGWIKDYLLFNRNIRNETNTYFLSGEYEWQAHERFSSTFGTRYSHILGNLSSYSAKENRLEFYALNTFKPFKKLGISLNLRQSVYDRVLVPFSPSISGQYDIVDKSQKQLSIKAAVSQSYKIPTLNDRFWIPGGNQDLTAEEALSWETGLVYQKKFKDNGALKAIVTYYRMAVENWIIWLPHGNIWSPSNIRNVSNKGLDISVNGDYQLGSVMVKGNVNYSYNQAENQTKININDRSLGKQLPYTPLHKMQWNLRTQVNNWEIFINQIYTGERYDTTDNESIVAPYTLWNAGMDYKWEISRLSGGLGWQVFNFLNEQYQAMKLRAMPGRNYQINLNINL